MLRIWQSNTARSMMVVNIVGHQFGGPLEPSRPRQMYQRVTADDRLTRELSIRADAEDRHAVIGSVRCTDRGEDLQPRPRRPQLRSHRLTTRALNPQDAERLDSSGWTPIQRGHYEHIVTLRPGRWRALLLPAGGWSVPSSSVRRGCARSR